jgi:hypothetical protein
MIAWVVKEQTGQLGLVPVVRGKNEIDDDRIKVA